MFHTLLEKDGGVVKIQAKDKDLKKWIQKAATAIGEADAVLISAGAGMGIDSGLPDFRGNKGFWRAYPVIKKMGLAFEDMANPRWFERDSRLAWGFYGHRLNLYRRTTPHAGFTQLLEMGKEKKHGCFVLTSNVDGQFQTAGFAANRIEECHGSIHHLQCAQPCGNAVWHPQNIEIAIDSEFLRAIGTLPSCQQCRSLARPNILMFNDNSWIGKRTKEQGERLWQWLEELLVTDHHLVIIEIGAGNAVPTIRRRSEFYAKVHRATLIRINPHDYDVPKSRHVSLPMGGGSALEAIWQVWSAENRQSSGLEPQ